MKMNLEQKKYKNNFDLIRLFAASQVFIHHLYHILGVDYGIAINKVVYFLSIFPGVPIFFFISGYLISQSFNSSSNIKEYFIKRVLRIYPALIASVIFGILLIVASGYLSEQSVIISDWAILIFTKITIFQFYNPDFLRAYGDGVFNGNLWTITVEIQFYVLTVVIFIMKNKFPLEEKFFWASILIISLFLNRLYIHFIPYHENELWFKLFGISFAPWFYMFVMGVIAQQYKHIYFRYIEKYALLIISCYIVFAYLGLHFKIFDYGNHISPILFFNLSAVILCFAYKVPCLSHRLVNGQDISYGIYLYHMLVINFFIYIFQDNAKQYSILIVGIVVFVSIISWFFLEKHAINLKKRLA